MGVLQLGQGQLDAGIATLQQAREQNENDFMVHANLGLALDSAGRLEEAVKSYRRARQLNPKIPNDLLQNAEIKLREKRVAEQKAGK